MTEVNSQAIEELKRLVEIKGSKKAAAEALDIHPSYLGEILNGTRELSDNVLAKLGYTKVVVHVKSERVPKVVRAIESTLAQ